jgi:hypothetical protein
MYGFFCVINSYAYRCAFRYVDDVIDVLSAA